MRNPARLLPLLLIAGCSQQPERRSSSHDLTISDVSDANMSSTTEADTMVPLSRPAARSPSEAASSAGIDVTAAPGVAFNYRYAFRLPSVRIGSVQEAHAQMCEKLGLARCRITGMRYRLENERDISAMLALKLDPALARNFGKDATVLVTRSQGMLVDQEISGVDAGASITDANRAEAQLRDDIAKLEAELRRPGLANLVRDRLLAELSQLRAQNRSIDTGREADRESLARTPMVFAYGSGSLIPGFDTTSPVRDAWEGSVANFGRAAGFLLMLLAALLPWALLAGLAWWIVRRVRPGWPGPRRPRATEPRLDAEPMA